MRIKVWIKAIRAPFFTGVAIPVIFGAALAYYMNHGFDWPSFLVTLIGIIFAHAAANLSNDYYDSKTDDINKNVTPFSGGSRMIQEKQLTPKQVITGASLCWAIALACGIYLYTITPGYTVLWLALAGFIGGLFYTASKLAFAYNRIGELMILINFGILPVVGAYFVQTGQLDWLPFWTSFPIGFLITAILYINQYPDYEADKAANKNHLVVTLGKEKARIGYYFLIFGNYLALILAVIFTELTPFALIGLLTVPIAVKTVKIFAREYNNVEELIPAQAGTIQMHLLTGLLMSIGCIVGKLV